MARSLVKLQSAFERLLGWMADIGGVATFIIMVLVVINALSRKLFNHPVPASVEMTQFLMPFAIMLPMGLAQLTGTHIRVTIFTSRLPLSVSRGLYVLAMILGCLLFAWLAYASLGVALKSYRVNEMVWGAGIRFPVYPAKFAVFVGAVLISIQFLFDVIRSVVLPAEETIVPDPETEGALNV